MTFNLAFWLFCFNYYAFSWRIKLLCDNKSFSQYQSRLRALQISGCAISLVFPLIAIIFWSNDVISDTFTVLSEISPIFSSYILFSGLFRIKSSTQAIEDALINAKEITKLLVASIFVIITILGMCVFGALSTNHYGWSTYMDCVQSFTYLICEIILYNILNKIAEKAMSRNQILDS